MEKKKKAIIHSAAAEYLTYTAATGGSETSMEMRYEDENIWLTQRMMAELYGGECKIKCVSTQKEHLRTLFLS